MLSLGVCTWVLCPKLAEVWAQSFLVIIKMIKFQVRYFARRRLGSFPATKSTPTLQKNVEISIDSEDALLAFLRKEGLAVPVNEEKKVDQEVEKVDMKALERRQAKIEHQLVGEKEEKSVVVKKPIEVDDEYDRKVLQQFSTGDDTLNHHVLGNIPLKLVDFKHPRYYQMLKLQKTVSKKQVYEQMFDKLRIMFDVKYTSEDFDELKMYHLNSDQLFALLESHNFVENAKLTRLVDCLKGLQKSRQVKIFKDHPLVMNLVHKLAQQDALTELPVSYVSSFAHACSKAKLDDEQVWFQLAAHVSQRHEEFDLRNLSTFTYALTNISRFQPVILNFDDLYRKLELSFIKKFDNEKKFSGQDIAITLTSYSKSQNGSIQFWQSLEGVIINNQDKLSTQELANCIYSYWKAENAEAFNLYEALKPLVKAKLHKMKPVELCQILMAFTEVRDGEIMDPELIEQFQAEFKGRFESMNPIDSSNFYYCFTKLGFQGDGLFYKYIQKVVTKTIRAFEGPHLRLMFYKFDDEENSRLNKGVRGRLIEHCRYLIREKQLSGFDAHNIYLYTKNLKYEPSQRHDYVVDMRTEEQETKDYKYHDLHIELRNYLEKLRYFT